MYSKTGLRRLAAGTSGDGGGGRAEQGVTAYDQVLGPGEAIQRSSVGEAGNY